MKSYVIVGLGARSIMYQDAITKDFTSNSRLVAICDINEGRLEFTKKKLKTLVPNIATYHSSEFDKMILENHPDYVVVCNVDAFHNDYICRAMELGCDVITEKPMTTDEAKCQKIIDTAKHTGKNVRVTFNYRYSPVRTQIKDLLMKNTIGNVLSVDFKWLLDTFHGADYYRRWHRKKRNSGGLLVHKSTHHFDLVNWWLSDFPQTVNAMGEKVFYNEKQARLYGLEGHGKRCLNCEVKDNCNFFLDMSSLDSMKDLYLDQEQFDGYERDKCVFSDEIDIEDTMSVSVGYNKGTLLNYSLNSFSPWEGYHIAFNGTKGRLEHFCQESSYTSGDGNIPGQLENQGTWIKVYPHFKSGYEIKPQVGHGSHGGGDDVMLNDIFGNSSSDKYLRSADYIQGAYSVLVGIAANKSIMTGRKINIGDLVTGLNAPEYPLMPQINNYKICYIKNSLRKKSNGETFTPKAAISISAPE